MLSRAVEQLMGRASGPLHVRLVMLPTLVTLLARAFSRQQSTRARVGE